MVNKHSNFIKKFNNGNGFYDYKLFTEGDGFSIKKDLNRADDNTSLLKFYILDDLKHPGSRKPIIISASYGKKLEESILIRDKTKISDPIDLTSKDEYYYNVKSDKLYKGEEEISASELLNGIYTEHIKPTKLIKGVWLRTKIVFWRIIMKRFFSYISIFLHYFLYIITSDKYSYEPIMEEEILNNKIISSRFEDMIGRKKKEDMKEHFEKGKKINIFGYEASRWIIIFYSILHLLLYIIFKYKNWYLMIITTIFRNNFLTLVYVISSLWVMEIVIPTIFRKLIKFTSLVSWNSSIKKIKI